MQLSVLILPLLSVAITNASPHRNLHRRHHAKAAVAARRSVDTLASIRARRDSGEFDIKLEGRADDGASCTQDGAWQCNGQNLERCNFTTWVTVATCTGDTVCSATDSATGCVWAWQLSDSDEPSSSPSPSAGLKASSSAITSTDTAEQSKSTLSAQSGNGGSYVNENGDEPSASPNGPVSTLAAVSSATLIASPSPSPSPSQSAIGGNLWAGENGQNGWYSKNRHSSAEPSASSSPTGDDGQWAESSSTDWSASSSTQDWWSPSSTGASQPSLSPSPSGIVEDGTGASASASASTRDAKSKSRHSASATAASSSKAAQATSVTPPSGSFSAPHYVIYADNWLSKMPSAAELGSYNRFILAFWMVQPGAVDNAQAWEQFDADYRAQVIEEYHSAGIALMVSAFGSTDSPTTNGADPVDTATRLADWVKQYGLDGVDIDYEDMTAMNNDQAESWLVSFQAELRRQLPAPYLISHAPVAPWFTSANAYPSGAYVKVHQETGTGIDFYNIQFYNQGDGVYGDCNTLVYKSGGSWPSTSVMEINSYAGVPLDKIVIGKPLDSGDAANGYIDAATLSKCAAEAQTQGWNGGVMFWEWADHAPSLMATVLASLR